jgi:hypothetical protein
MSNDLALVAAVVVFFGTGKLWETLERDGRGRDGKLIFIGVNLSIFVLLIIRYVIAH